MGVFFAEGQHDVLKSRQLLEGVGVGGQELEELLQVELWVAEANVDDEAVLLEQSHHEHPQLVGELVGGEGDV